MDHQLRAAWRDHGHQFHQFGGLETAGNLETREVVRGAASVAGEAAVEPAPQQPQRVAREPLQARHSTTQRIEGKIERPPHPAYAELLRQVRHRVQYGRRQVGVLVSVQVAGPHTGIHDAPHLRRQLVVHPNPARGQRRHQLRHRRRKRLLREQRVAADQHQVTADVEPGCLARQADRILEGIAVGHQGGRGQDAVAVRFHDAGVDVRREAEIVGVDYELFPRRQNRASRMVRNFLGLARMSLASDWNSRVAPFSESYNAGFTSICPSVPCPELSLSMVPLNLATSSSSRWCRASSLSNLPAVPLPALRSASRARISPSDALASSYSAGSLSSLPALPLPACKSARMASTRLMGERISWYSASS